MTDQGDNISIGKIVLSDNNQEKNRGLVLDKPIPDLCLFNPTIRHFVDYLWLLLQNSCFKIL